jgi:nucleoside-diphosphate-sugar epimerase
LVTGGTGFVAAWCIAELLDAGYEVVTSVRAPQREREVRDTAGLRAGDRLEFVVADLTSDAGWDDALAGCEYVLHVASPLSVDLDDTAIAAAARDGTLRLLATSARLRSSAPSSPRCCRCSAASSSTRPRRPSASSDGGRAPRPRPSPTRRAVC